MSDRFALGVWRQEPGQKGFDIEPSITIGLFISHSGLDAGAFSVVRRAVNSKTVVVFGRREIDAVLIEHTELGAIFDEELRNAYDYIFEQHYQQ
jgi:hypothetical protein